MDDVHRKVYVYAMTGYDVESIAAEVGMDAATVKRILDEVAAETAGRPGWKALPTANPTAAQRAEMVPEAFTTRDGLDVQILMIPSDRIEAEWTKRTTAAGRPTRSPVILGNRPFPPNELGRLIEQSRRPQGQPAAVLLATAATLDPAQVLAARWQDTLPIGEDANDPMALESFDEAAPSGGVAPIPRRLLPKSGPVALALVPAASGYEIPAVLGWGNFNACPPPEEHVAIMRHWHQRYSAQLQAMTYDSLEFAVANPPTSFEAALPLAREQYAYANDIIDQGKHPTIGALAAALVGSEHWQFWWD